MAVYNCGICDKWLDNDYFPAEYIVEKYKEYPACEDCVAEIEENASEQAFRNAVRQGNSKHGRRGFASTIMMSYIGTNKRLISGRQYSRHELAKAFNVSYAVACNKLQGKRKAVDADFWKNPVILVKFVGKHKDLTAGKYYTLQELADVCGISRSAMSHRIKKRPECTVQDLRAKKAMPPATSLTARWLRRGLI
jgi:DNA-binding Xre family transcriptional regulator